MRLASSTSCAAVTAVPARVAQEQLQRVGGRLVRDRRRRRGRLLLGLRLDDLDPLLLQPR
jgi:hypothetical protein